MAAHRLNEQYRERLLTYCNYPPNAPKFATRLAESGFVYVGEGQTDKVRCDLCGQEKENWTASECIRDVHLGTCPVVTGVQSGNTLLTSPANRSLSRTSTHVRGTRPPSHPPTGGVASATSSQSHPPIEEGASATRLQSQPITDARNASSPAEESHTASSGVAIASSLENHQNIAVSLATRTNSRIANAQVTTSAGHTSTNTATSVTMSQHDTGTRTAVPGDSNIPKKLARHPEMAEIRNRLDTFQSSPFQIRAEPMAGAGFSYSGPGDRVRCFHCGLVVSGWTQSSDPREQHARLSPDCEFIRAVLGPDRVNSLRGNNAERLPPDTRTGLRGHPSVKYLIKTGENEADVLEAARILKTRDTHGVARLTLRTLPRVMSQAWQQNGNYNTTVIDVAETRRLRREARLKRERIICRNCRVKEVEIVFLPYCHMVVCVDCAFLLLHCPLPRCRAEIKGFHMVFL